MILSSEEYDLEFGEILLIIAPPYLITLFSAFITLNSSEWKIFWIFVIIMDVMGIIYLFYAYVRCPEKFENDVKKYGQWRAEKDELQFLATSLSGLGIFSYFLCNFNVQSAIGLIGIVCYALLILGINYRRLTTMIYWYDEISKKTPQNLHITFRREH